MRLFAVAALTLVAALVVVSLLGRQAARTEFRRFTLSERAVRGAGAPEDLAARIGAEPDSTRLDALLEQLGRGAQRELLLVSPEGRRIAASSAELRAALITVGPGDDLTIERHAGDGRVKQ